jgi:hypothetical protein
MMHLGGSLDAYALDGHRRITQYAQTHFGARDGLPHNDAGVQRVARYTDLPPGNHRFIVEAGLDNAWGAPATLAFTLPPLFYQTGWFHALALLSLAAWLGTHRPARVRGRGRR